MAKTSRVCSCIALRRCIYIQKCSPTNQTSAIVAIAEVWLVGEHFLIYMHLSKTIQLQLSLLCKKYLFIYVIHVFSTFSRIFRTYTTVGGFQSPLFNWMFCAILFLLQRFISLNVLENTVKSYIKWLILYTSSFKFLIQNACGIFHIDSN